MRDSPEHSRETNLRRANQVAVKALEKTTRLSQVYGDESFPVIALDDPCGLLRELPVWMTVQPAGFSRSATDISLRPVLERTTPGSASWLGRLQIATYREDDTYISEVCLNQPGNNRGITLGRHTQQYNRHGGLQSADSYPSNSQAMQFIGMVDEYLDKLDQNRLAVVGE
jgi:hypothetical protein